MVTEVPTAPAAGLRPVILGTIPKIRVLLLTPETTTLTPTLLYGSSPLGTTATILVSLQLVTVAEMEPMLRELVPWVAPKPVPVMVTELPAGPEVGLSAETSGPTVTVKGIPLLACPPTVTTTLPVVAPAGTGTTMLVALQLEGVAAVPLKVTLLAPWEAPKFEPEIVTGSPTTPLFGLTLEIVGKTLGVTEKLTPLLSTPPTRTTTLPLVAPNGTGATMLVSDQLVGGLTDPLKATKLEPCVELKPVPAIVTEAPTCPDEGVKVDMCGLGGVTVKATPLLGAPPTVTTTLPVVAEAGTTVTMEVSLQLVALA